MNIRDEYKSWVAEALSSEASRGTLFHGFVRLMDTLSPAALKLYIYLTIESDDGTVENDVKRFAADLSMSRAEVERMLHELVDTKLISLVADGKHAVLSLYNVE